MGIPIAFTQSCNFYYYIQILILLRDHWIDHSLQQYIHVAINVNSLIRLAI
jgi:hypothetical protein